MHAQRTASIVRERARMQSRWMVAVAINGPPRAVEAVRHTGATGTLGLRCSSTDSTQHEISHGSVEYRLPDRRLVQGVGRWASTQHAARKHNAWLLASGNADVLPRARAGDARCPLAHQPLPMDTLVTGWACVGRSGGAHRPDGVSAAARRVQRDEGRRL